MDKTFIDRLTNAVLYEGYLLYPYRPALKNAKRWSFGTLYPAKSQVARAGDERCTMRARVLVVGDGATLVEAELRFLQLIERTDRRSNSETQIWHECEERRIEIPLQRIDDLTSVANRRHFEFDERKWYDSDLPLDSALTVVRRQEAIRGAIQAHAEKLDENLYLLSLSVTNETPVCATAEHSHEQDVSALPRRILFSAREEGNLFHASIRQNRIAISARSITRTVCGQY